MKRMIIALLAGCLVLFALVGLKRILDLSNHEPQKSTTSSSKTLEKTFALIKPDAVDAKNSGKIIDVIENHGFEIVRMQKITLTPERAEQFYAVHKERPFYKDLITFITSGPVITLVLQKENAVKDWRNLMGATDPEKAEEGTIRKLFGTNVQQNAVHGSDSIENAKIEITQFFPEAA